MERIAKLDGCVTGFAVQGEHIDCACGLELIKLNKRTGEPILKRRIFEKEGYSRDLAADREAIYVYDFITLLAFRADDYSPIGEWRLGNDLTSDICGMLVDTNAVYCSLRNGAFAAVDRQTGEVSAFSVANSSMWSVKAYGESLLCGTVDGNVLLLDKQTLSVQRALKLGRQNIASLYIAGDTAYAAGQDKKLYRIDLERFELINARRNAHGKMFRIAGMRAGGPVTVSHPAGEIRLWDAEAQEMRGEMRIPLKLSGGAHVEGDMLYIASRNIRGIDRVDLRAICR